MFTSTDAGATWTATSNFAAGDYLDANLCSSPTTPGRLLLALFPAYASRVASEIWTRDPAQGVWTEVTPPHPHAHMFLGSTIRGGSPEEFWVCGTASEVTTAGSGVLLRSIDGGTTWTPLGRQVFPSAAETVAVDGAGGTNVFVGTANDGVFFSGDNGTTWAARKTGLSSLRIFHLVADTARTSVRVYAGTASGVFWSDNLGGNWTRLGTLLSDTSVHRVVLDGATIYAGTKGRGVWRIAAP